jgi:hypothetical protein
MQFVADATRAAGGGFTVRRCTKSNIYEIMNMQVDNMKKQVAGPHKDMVSEVVALREEVQQLRQMVNMLLDIVVDPEEGEDFGLDPTGGKKGDKGGRPLMCM